MNTMSCRPRDEEIRVAHLVKGLSLDENEWEELDNQSMEMDIECIRHDSKDDNVDTWEPDRYEVHKIIAHKVVNGRDLYLVMWRGYSKDTWEPAENLDDCREKLEEFRKLSNEMKITEQCLQQYECDPKERDLFLNAHNDSGRINFDLYDKIILGRIKKDYEYNEFVSDLMIECVPVAEISERGRKEEEEANRREEYDLF